MLMLEILVESAKVSFVYCLFLFLLHLILAKVSNVLITRANKKLNKKNERIWQNKAVATMHAITMFYLTMSYWFTINPDMTIPSEVGEREKLCLDLMMGYLWYDSIWEIVSDGQVDTLGHHILGLVSHLSTRLSNHGGAGFYSILVYIAEGSTPALHLCWLLHQLKFTHLAFYKALIAYLLVAFFVFRIILSPYMLWHMHTFQLSWGESVTTFGSELFYLYWGNFLIVFLFCALNYFWFYKLVSVVMKAV